MNIGWSNKNSTQPFSVLSKYYFAFVIILVMHRYVENCSADNDDNYGWMFPQGEITVKVNEPLKLYCTINENSELIQYWKRFLSSVKVYHTYGITQIYQSFTFGLSDGTFVAPSYLTRENETTFSMILENKEESKNKYSCIMSSEMRKVLLHLAPKIQVNRRRNLRIDFEEQNVMLKCETEIASTVVVVRCGCIKNVKNIACNSINWQELKCTWDVPKNNFETNYTIEYMPLDDRNKTFSKCPNDDDVRSHTCTWTLSTKPPYYRNYETLTMMIRGVNRYNETKQLFNITNFELVWPKKPSNLRLVNRTCTSMLLEWDIGDFKAFPKKLIYKITYKPTCDSKWPKCRLQKIIIDGKNISYVVTNLIPNMLYDFRVRMKVFNASKKFWSKDATKKTTTLSCPPFRCPKSDVGSFWVEERNPVKKTRTVYIYWKALLPFEHNGKNFSYHVNVLLNDSVDLRNQTAIVRLNSEFDPYAKYKIGLFSYSFYITAQNNEGRAPNASIVKVPSELIRIRSDVGTGQKMVENVSCISYNWKKLKCTWDVPTNNVKTKYTIQYMPDDDRFKNFSKCPNNDDVHSNSCTWTLSSKPPYYKDYETLTIVILRGVNRFNETEQLLTINHFDHVLPEGPYNLRLMNRTCTSILLKWDIGDFKNFSKKLIYKITYKPTCDSKWPECRPQKIIIVDEKRSYIVTNLFPNTVYKFQVQVKVKNASKKFWSKGYHATKRTTTLSCPPFRCPKTDVGSFRVEERNPVQKTRTVYIYWQALRPFEQNGKNFFYNINVSLNDSVDARNQTPIVRLNSKFDSYAKYKIGFFSYSIYITAQNNKGRAPNASIVKVPSEFIRIRSDPLLKKIDQYDRNTSELSWMPLQRIIDDYTIFFWQIETFRPFQYDSFIQWTHVSANTTNFTLPSNISSDYQFAISINTPDSNSGMMWITSQHGTKYQDQPMEPDTKPSVDIGWRFSDNEQKKRMEQFFDDTCVIRINGITNRYEKECFLKKSSHTRDLTIDP